MNKFSVFLVFLIIPFLVFLFLVYSYTENLDINKFSVYSEEIKYKELSIGEMSIHKPAIDIKDLVQKMINIQNTVFEFNTFYKEFSKTVDSSISSSKEQKTLSEDIYEQRITRALGKYIDFYLSDNVEIKIFELKELGYRGYIAKVKLFNPDVFKLSLAKGEKNKLETTSEAAIRTGAVLAINGGGFGASKKEDGTGISSMVGGAIVDGVVVEEFKKKQNEDLFFVGINKRGDLVGSIPNNQKDVDKLNAYQGASFIPILIQHGQKIPLPSAWKRARHPRTIIGQYANDDLILIVVDGRQGEYSKGITLERLQDKLLKLGVKDAYNLDGGGSTAMYFKNKLLNKPSDGKERPVANNFIILK